MASFPAPEPDSLVSAVLRKLRFTTELMVVKYMVMLRMNLSTVGLGKGVSNLSAKMLS